MPTSRSPSSSSQEQIVARPTAIKSASRRLPPPCWSNDETVALIDAYRDKWYSLRRGNLRAPHWQEVADDVAARCPLSNPPKTSIQCRHKMEKLRKRYRAEIQRIGGHRHPSSWLHFRLMDSMQLGTSCTDPSVDPGNQEDDDDEDVGDDENEDELMLHPKGIKQAIALPINRRYQGSIGNGVDAGNGNGNGNGVRIRIPNRAAVQPPPPALMYNSNRSFDDYPPPVNPRYKKEGFGPNRNHADASRGMKLKRKEVMEKNDSNLMDRMVAAIHKLGDDFVKTERMKMDMAREIEKSRMEMEMERTKMILESQQKLVDSFSKTVMESNKKMKRIPTPES